MDDMHISFLGGAREIGGSCMLLRIYNKNILLDCGVRQNSSKDALPDFKLIQDNGGVDAIVISHAHRLSSNYKQGISGSQNICN